MASANIAAFYFSISAFVICASFIPISEADEDSMAQTVIYSMVNHTVRLSCPLPKTRTTRVEWFDYIHNDNPDPQRIFSGTAPTLRNMDSNHPNRHSYEVDSNFTLIIRNVTLEEAGSYKCTCRYDNYTLEKNYYIAISEFPQCSGASVMSVGESANFTCKSQFTGNYPPHIEWRRGPDIVWKSHDNYDIRLAMIEFNLDASAGDDGTTFICRMTFGKIVEECHIDLTVYYSLRDLVVDPWKDTYAVGEEIKCSANGNPTPDIIFNPSLIPGSTGVGWRSVMIPESFQGQTTEVECSASNTVNGHKETISRKIILKVTGDGIHETGNTDKGEANSVKSESASSSGAIVGGIVVGIMILVVVVAAVFCVRLRKEQTTKKEENGGTKVQTPPRDATTQIREREHQV